MAAHSGLVSFASDDAHPWREFIAALHGLFHVEVVVRGNAGHFAAMACAAFLWLRYDVFRHFLRPYFRLPGSGE